MKRLLYGLCAVLLAPVAAHAADVRVSYLVYVKLLKAIVAGTPLSFQLFADGSCTTPVATQVVNADAVSVIQELKLVKVKNGRKPLKSARLEHVLTGVTPQAAFYLKVTGSPAVVPAGGACQLQYASVGGTAPPPLPTCPPDSVKSGNLCVDTREASVWRIPSGNTALIQEVIDGTATLADLTGGGATQIGATPGNSSCTGSGYPATFPSDGNYTAPLYSVSVAGVLPSACITAYQAKAACEISGKRLMTNAEWIAAATGTPDPNTDNGTTDCNTGAPGTPTGAPGNTGSRSSCVSTAGTSDMIGNVYEWAEGAFGTAWVRGGDWDSGTFAGVFNAIQFIPFGQNSASAFGVPGSAVAVSPQSSWPGSSRWLDRAVFTKPAPMPSGRHDDIPGDAGESAGGRRIDPRSGAAGRSLSLSTDDRTSRRPFA